MSLQDSVVVDLAVGGGVGATAAGVVVIPFVVIVVVPATNPQGKFRPDFNSLVDSDHTNTGLVLILNGSVVTIHPLPRLSFLEV